MGIVSFSLLLLYNRYSFRENSIVLFCHFENEIHHSSIFGRRNAHDAVYLCCSIVRGTTRGRRKRNAKRRNRNAKRNRFDKRRQTNRREEASTSAPGYGCDLEDHLQGGGMLHLLGSCK